MFGSGLIHLCDIQGVLLFLKKQLDVFKILDPEEVELQAAYCLKIFVFSTFLLY